MNEKNLADAIRPQKLEELVGQEHIFGDGSPVAAMTTNKIVRNMIFYGPPGVGKTTAAEIISRISGKSFYKLNGTTSSLADVKEIAEKTGSLEGVHGAGILLYLDEIQYWNKKQQQSLLEYIEDGRIVLIASTTENPYFYVYKAIISRCAIFEFKPVSAESITVMLQRGLVRLNSYGYGEKAISEPLLARIARYAGGDVRCALGALEFAFYSSAGAEIAESTVEKIIPKSAVYYDRDGDEHYDLLSALHKSLRGSDENAALYYLAKLIDGGDLLSPIRRMLCMASEDVGLAYPMAAVIVKSLTDTAVQIGMPEARLMLGEAVIFLCTCPKSNSAMAAMDSALTDVRTNAAGSAPIPNHLRDASYEGAETFGRGEGYLYPHNYMKSYVKQDYLPQPLRERVYYNFGDNKLEQAAEEYRKQLLFSFTGRKK